MACRWEFRPAARRRLVVLGSRQPARMILAGRVELVLGQVHRGRAVIDRNDVPPRLRRGARRAVGLNSDRVTSRSLTTPSFRFGNSPPRRSGDAPDGTGLDPVILWHAISDPGLQTAAYLGVIVWEAAAPIVLAAAVVLWIRRRDSARRVATAGLLMIVLLFFGGFIDVGGEWFAMWRSTTWNGLDPAFRNAVLAISTLVLIHLPGADQGLVAAQAPENRRP